MHQIQRLGWFFLLNSIICFSCSPKPEKLPSGILTKDSMIAVLLAVHIAESSVNGRGLTNQQLNQLVAGKYDDVMLKNHTTFDVFQKSYDYYLQHPDQFEEIYLEVVNRLTALEGKSKAREPVKLHQRVDSLRTR